jgi:uncharacterized membrane protein YkoI
MKDRKKERISIVIYRTKKYNNSTILSTIKILKSYPSNLMTNSNIIERLLYHDYIMDFKILKTTILVSSTVILAIVIVLSGASSFITIQQNASAQKTADASTTNMTMMSDTTMEPRDMMMMRGENVTSSINLMNIITNALGSQIKVSLSNATTIAENSVGNNSHAVAAHLGDENGYLVYTIFVLDPNMNFNTVIVDPGNGQVLSSKQISKEEHLMMHKGMMGPGMMGPGMMGPGMMGPGMMGPGMMGPGMMGPGMMG